MAALLAEPHQPAPLLTGLDALRAWKEIEPICPLCALFKKGSISSAQDPSASCRGSCSPIRAVSMSQLLEKGTRPSTPVPEGAAGAHEAVAQRGRRSTFIKKANPTSPPPERAATTVSTPPPAGGAALSVPLRPQPKAVGHVANFPPDFPIYVSNLMDEKRSWSSLSTDDATRLMTNHCLYSGQCRWSLGSHQQEILNGINETNQKNAERRKKAAAIANGPGADVNANAGSNFAVAKMRSLVSQEKRRFQEDGFDLDLTYITRRVIAMGFPSHGKEAYFRNPVGEVERFFQQRHGDGHFRIYNLCSERVYDEERRFGGQYKRYPFDDHNAPCPITLVADMVNDATQFLQANKENVVAIHCKAGKGRTGLMVCCLLRSLESNKLRSAEEALNFFGTARTNDGQGVTIPSQHRYVHYWDYILKHWQGVPPPRAPPAKAAHAALAGFVGVATADPTTEEGPSTPTTSLPMATSPANPHRYITLSNIVIDSPIFVGTEIDGGAQAAVSGDGQGSGYGTDLFFIIEENNIEVFDSRKHTMLVPSRAAPLKGLPFHTTRFNQPENAPDVLPVFSNTKLSSKDFAVSTKKPGQHTAGMPFSGYVFNIPAPQQLSTCGNASLRNAGVNLKLAGDVRVTFFYKRQGLLGQQKESELFHFWFNTFLTQHMYGGEDKRPGSPTGAKLGQVASQDDLSGTSKGQPKDSLRHFKLVKHELDGVHKDTKNLTYCPNIAATLYFTVGDYYLGGDIVAGRSAKAKAMDGPTPSANQTQGTARGGASPAPTVAAGPAGRRTDPNAPPTDHPQPAPKGTQKPPQKAPEKKEEKGFFKSIFSF